MIRSIKMLGLLVTAALAIGALSASAAQAEVNLTTGLTDNGLGEVEHTGTHLDAVQTGANTSEETGDVVTTNYLETAGQKLSCEIVSYTGDTTASGGTQNDLTLTPEYKHCGLVVFNEATEEHELKPPATVEMNGCDYNLAEPTHNEDGTYTGDAKLECPGTGPIIKIYAAGTFTEPSLLICEQEIEPNQEFANSVTYENTNNGANPDTIDATVSANEVKYENLKKTCPGGLGTKEDGVFHSNVNLTSTEEDDVWLSTVE